MTVAVPAFAYADAMAADPDLAPALLSISRYESTYGTQPYGDYGLGGARPDEATSFGPMQLFTRGGLGDGHPIEELLDGPSNYRFGATEIRRRLANGQSLYEAMQPWSVRPQAYALYERMMAEGIEVEGGTAPDIYPAATSMMEEPRSLAPYALIGVAAIVGALVAFTS